MERRLGNNVYPGISLGGPGGALGGPGGDRGDLGGPSGGPVGPSGGPVDLEDTVFQEHLSFSYKIEQLSHLFLDRVVDTVFVCF